MGTYRVELQAVGDHGCNREVKDGGQIFGCQRMGCPDCETRRFIKQLKASGSTIESAMLRHWPGQDSQVVDDLLTGVRTGNF